MPMMRSWGLRSAVYTAMLAGVPVCKAARDAPTSSLSRRKAASARSWHSARPRRCSRCRRSSACAGRPSEYLLVRHEPSASITGAFGDDHRARCVDALAAREEENHVYGNDPSCDYRGTRSRPEGNRRRTPIRERRRVGIDRIMIAGLTCGVVLLNEGVHHGITLTREALSASGNTASCDVEGEGGNASDSRRGGRRCVPAHPWATEESVSGSRSADDVRFFPGFCRRRGEFRRRGGGFGRPRVPWLSVLRFPLASWACGTKW